MKSEGMCKFLSICNRQHKLVNVQVFGTWDKYALQNILVHFLVVSSFVLISYEKKGQEF